MVGSPLEKFSGHLTRLFDPYRMNDIVRCKMNQYSSFLEIATLTLTDGLHTTASNHF